MAIAADQVEDPHTPKARRIGMSVFWVAAILQMLVSGLVVASLVGYRYWEFRKEEMQDALPGMSEDQPAADFLRYGFAERFLWKFLEIVPALCIAAVAYSLLCAWMGRWAGKQIGIKGTRYGWVGLGATLFPSILSAILLVITFFVTDSDQSSDFQSFERDFVYPVLLFAGCFYVPGILFGIFAGLVSRQRFRGWQQLEQRVTEDTAA